MEVYRKTFAEINLDNLAHNIGEIQKAFPQNTFLCPMVKANAYGHGDVQISKALEKLGIKNLGVCLVEEGVRLRNSGIHAQILVFGGFDEMSARILLEHNLTPVVSSWRQLAALESSAMAQIVKVHLKFDSGMNRLGFPCEEASKLFEFFSNSKKVKVCAVVTHLYNGEDAADEQGHSAVQLQKFSAIVKMFEPLNVFVHALNSSGIISRAKLQKAGKTSKSHPLFEEEWGLRPGLMIYGYETVSENSVISLKPVMTLKAQVNTLRKVLVGETVSYGGSWQARRDSVVAIIAAGYADGYHRILSNQSSALFEGQRVPAVGTICMDYMMLDVTDVVQDKDLKLFQNAEVVLFGQSTYGGSILADELARFAKTNSYEILTSISARVPRVFKGTTNEAH